VARDAAQATSLVADLWQRASLKIDHDPDRHSACLKPGSLAHNAIDDDLAPVERSRPRWLALGFGRRARTDLTALF